MWSSDNPISDENQIPAVQNVHRKSVGRTPLKVLAVIDPNTVFKKRSSLSKTSSHPVLVSKESPRVSVGTPVSVWIDPCHNNNLIDRSESEASTSKKRPSSVLDSLTVPTGPENCDQLSQSDGIAVLSQPIDSANSQTAISANEENPREPVNEGVHGLLKRCDELLGLPSTIITNEPAVEDYTWQKAPLMSDEPGSHDGARDVLTSHLKHITLENTDSLDDENIAANILHISKPEIVPSSMRNDSRLEDLLLEDELDGAEVVSEPNVVTSENDSYDVDPQSSVSVIDVLSEVTEFIENWNLSIRDDYQGVPADVEGFVEACRQVEVSSFAPGTEMDDLNQTQLLRDLPSRPDSVVSNNSEKSLHDTFIFEDCLLTEAIFHCAEMSSRRSQNYTSGNKCCTPIDGLSTDHLLAEGDFIPLTDTNWFSPISNMDQVCQSDPNPDQGDVMKNIPFTESCPTPIMPNQSKVQEFPLLSKGMFKNVTPRMFPFAHEAGTTMTPVSTAEGGTWTTPIMLLNKSMNTSCDFVGKGKKSAKDNASETDSVLWNFSREALCNASREELMDRLEGSLIVVEVLSRQLQGWQQNNLSSKPSEQRECSTQTRVTYTSTEEQYYHNLYMNTLGRLQSVQHSKEQEETLHQHLKVATEALTLHKNEASSMIELAKSLYEMTQKDRADLQHKMNRCHKLLADHMSILEKKCKKLKDNLRQRDEMRARMEEALLAKEAADQCLQDLEIHSSAVITQLRRDLESERQLCESVKEANEQQRSYNEELTEFVHRAQYVCSEVEEDRTQLHRQCSQARELMSQHWRLFDVMKEKTQSILEECEGFKMERDMAVLENEKVYSDLENITSQTEQLKLENSRLGSELELLIDRVCSLESKIEQLKEENCELEELLSAKDSSMKLLEKELNEATARGQQYQDRIKHLTSHVVSRLELDLSNTLNQKEALQKRFYMVAKEHASQIAYYRETLEFLEQENVVCREQVAETESQLKTHHLTVLERNFQCENLKDTVKELQKEVGDLQEKLSHSQGEAQTRIMNLSKEISDSSIEVSKIKSHMLELLENLSENTKTEASDRLPGSQTPGRSRVSSKNEELTTTTINVADSGDQREGIWSKTSAFTVVLPITLPSAGTPKEHLTDVVCELSSIAADVVSASSSAMEEKQQIIQDLKMEISSLEEKLQSQRFQHTSEMRVLQEELGNLKRRNCILDEKINSKEKCIRELQEVVNLQEHKMLQQFTKAKESEVLIEENAALQLSLKVCEKEVEVLKQELTQNSTEAARNWIQEKLLLHKDITALRLKLVDTEYSKSESIQRLLRHKDILKANLERSEAEVRKLDATIIRIRQGLLSVPEVVNGCDKLRALMELI